METVAPLWEVPEGQVLSCSRFRATPSSDTFTWRFCFLPCSELSGVYRFSSFHLFCGQCDLGLEMSLFPRLVC